MRAFDRHARTERDALLFQRGRERGGGLLVLGGEDVGECLQDRDLRPEPRVDLRELDPDRPGADDHERPGRLRRLPDRLLVRPERPVLQPVDRRDRGVGSGGEHDPVGLDLRAVRELDRDADRSGCASCMKTRMPARSNGAAPSPDWASMTSRARCWTARKVHGHRRDPHAEPAGVPRERRDLRAPQHHLRRDAPVVVAFAAEQIALGDGDAHAFLTEAERHLGAGPAAADHEDVEALHSYLARAPEEPDEDPGVDPRGRDQVVDERPIRSRYAPPRAIPDP